jgi:hypothetical protein
MTKRKRDNSHPHARISACISAKYFSTFLQDVDLHNLSMCNPVYYCDFYSFFANRIWWSTQATQFVSASTLKHIRKLSYSPYDCNGQEIKQLPQRITSLLLVKAFRYQEFSSILVDKYKNDLQFLEVVGPIRMEIPNGVKVFIQTCPSPLGGVLFDYHLNLPESLLEVSMCCPQCQQILEFPSRLTKLTFGVHRGPIFLPSFPTSLLHLTLTDGFNQQIDEFPSNLVSLTIQNNNWNQHLVSLPSGLQYFKLYGKSTIPLNPGLLPPSLKIFIYKSKCNIQENVLPLQLKYFSITIDSDYGLYFDCKFLPQSVVQLNITSFHPYGLLHMQMIPESVMVFKYKTCGQLHLSQLPQKVEELYLHTTGTIFMEDSADFHKYCNGKDSGPTATRFPPHLKHLYVRPANFCPKLRQDVFPSTLETLHFNCNDRINRNILHTGLKHLSLGKKCKRLLVFGSLPKSLESFSAPHLSSKTIKLYQKTGLIPKSCLIK